MISAMIRKDGNMRGPFDTLPPEQFEGNGMYRGGLPVPGLPKFPGLLPRWDVIKRPAHGDASTWGIIVDVDGNPWLVAGGLIYRNGLFQTTTGDPSKWAWNENHANQSAQHSAMRSMVDEICLLNGWTWKDFDPINGRVPDARMLARRYNQSHPGEEAITLSTGDESHGLEPEQSIHQETAKHPVWPWVRQEFLLPPNGDFDGHIIGAVNIWTRVAYLDHVRNFSFGDWLGNAFLNSVIQSVSGLQGGGIAGAVGGGVSGWFDSWTAATANVAQGVSNWQAGRSPGGVTSMGGEQVSGTPATAIRKASALSSSIIAERPLSAVKPVSKVATKNDGSMLVIGAAALAAYALLNGGK
jgi:hypothetical protein